MTDAIDSDIVSLSSSPCLLTQQDPELAQLQPAAQQQTVMHSLCRVFGVRPPDGTLNGDHLLLTQLCTLFQKDVMDADTELERHQRPWSRVYLVQHGVLRLFRESPSGKVSIHHFFAEGDIAWPVFGRSRTVRNTLCLSTVTPCTLWVADFHAFRDVLRNHCEGKWARFALALTEELAELATKREFHRQTLSARERYDQMVTDYPELMARVPDFQLASWLGVVPATFSRLKKGRC
ncbi:Crp/Fnr family transcriptional regulator [Marinobacter zhejiangensis]|uniref:cAMP-binding domain of CRP or a regulatory subunit of cAMP-dependent protein kinases n=1 Tax=Marinobacter zhejiangensis TaxID=488535 RepID=A0A1I4LUD1_9GAMM|nr:Crp/Fnr family transcriptional regulator [Marinobacter zhejiangensis]SFL94632.1 cAMP-binding domain of CRP or a regulatory subunit of cAMP-dependent protein kinases [Marinobacter zhejiangensis]